MRTGIGRKYSTIQILLFFFFSGFRVLNLLHVMNYSKLTKIIPIQNKMNHKYNYPVQLKLTIQTRNGLKKCF